MTMIPPYFNLFDYFLGDDRSPEIGRRTAIEFRGGRITYDELRTEVDYWSGQILACGAGQGDRVAILLYDSPEFIATFLAAVSIGAIAVPINTFLSPDEVIFIISDSGARVVIVEEELEHKVDSSLPDSSSRCSILIVDTEARPYLELKEEIAPRPAFPSTTREDPAFLLYTSGSTGAPKGVLHLHGSIPYTVESYSDSILRLTSEDRLYSASRLFFAYGLGNSLSFPMAAGATVILDSERPQPARVAKIFEEQRPTIFFGVPAVYRALLELRAQGGQVDASSLRCCVSAGEALPASIFEEWERAFNLQILDGIGSTEMLHIFISNRAGSARAGSSGRTVDGYQARLVDDSGAEVKDEQLGNLWVSGKSATVGYWKRAELTAQTIAAGWVKTGDIYRRDETGFFYHIGRSDDCFKVRGLWVSPVEVEAALLAHPSVTEAAVVSAQDGKGLATARAFVVIRTDGEREALKEELREFLGSRLPQHKVPSEIDFIQELPRTSTGKVQRYKLRAEGQTSRHGGPDED
jgi:benzoate-CoA ligase family protein